MTHCTTTPLCGWRRAPLFACLAVALALGASTTPTFAANLSVTSCLDDGGANTLRSRVAAAMSGDTVDFLGLAPSCSTITLQTGAIPIAVDDLIIQGPAPGSGALSISGAGSGPKDRIFTHTGTGTLSIEYLTIEDGHYTVSAASSHHGGGCIYSAGDVSLSAAAVVRCIATQQGGIPAATAGADGGGIFALGQVTLLASTVSGNRAESTQDGHTVDGGGILAHGLVSKYSTIADNRATAGLNTFSRGGGASVIGYATILGSTIDGNRATEGGGLALFNNPALIVNSTLSGNVAESGGGGIFAVTPLTLSNTTVAFNQSSTLESGIFFSSEALALEASIVADNFTYSGSPGQNLTPGRDLSLSNNATLSGNHSLVMNANVTLPVGTIILNPRLAPLGNHGGMTRIHALLPDSPAINAGSNNLNRATDQRGNGFSRENPTGAADIGAYERQAIDDQIYYDGFSSLGG